MKILYLDDNELMVSVYAELLELNGFFVVPFHKPEEALSYVNSTNCADIDLIISDIQMPNMNGIEFYNQVRQTHSKIPFIFLTGQSEKRDIPKDTSWIEKPVQINTLLSEIKNKTECPSSHSGDARL